MEINPSELVAMILRFWGEKSYFAPWLLPTNHFFFFLPRWNVECLKLMNLNDKMSSLFHLPLEIYDDPENTVSLSSWFWILLIKKMKNEGTTYSCQIFILLCRTLKKNLKKTKLTSTITIFQKKSYYFIIKMILG